MRFSVISVFALVAAVSSQSLPSCVTPCYTNNVAASGCTSATDLACLCTSAKFQQLVGACLETSCTTQADLTTAVMFGTQSCLAAGITVSASALTLATGAASSGAASTSSVAVTSASASSTPAVVVASSSSKAATAASSMTSAVTATAAPVTPTTAAAKSAGRKVYASIGLAGLAIAFVTLA